MLLGLLYHNVGNGKYANSLSFFESHFKWIADHYITKLPGEKVSSKLEVCLTFDDAFFDFYYFIFPLLKKYKLKALLSVPTAFIPKTTQLSPQNRLDKIFTLSERSRRLASPAFCTWEELKELQDSSIIEIASHSVNHLPLTSSKVDPIYELQKSKDTLESKLKGKIQTFVYPYGKLSPQVHKYAKNYYPYLMRIGNAINYSWTNCNRLFYRVNGDQLPHKKTPFLIRNKFKYFYNLPLNILRNK